MSGVGPRQSSADESRKIRVNQGTDCWVYSQLPVFFITVPATSDGAVIESRAVTPETPAQPSLTLETLIRQHPEQIAAEADGEVLMMHIESGNYFGLNEVASFIWNQLEEPRRIDAICAAVLSEFDVDEARCQTDALAFLQGMIDDELVQVASAEPSPETGSEPRSGLSSDPGSDPSSDPGKGPLADKSA